jgi:N-acetylmuramoyl-L-alanine amidase
MFCLRRYLPISVVALLCLPLPGAAAGQGAGPSRVQAVRFWSFGDVTRIAIETTGEYRLASDQIENPARVYFDLNGLRPPATAHRGMQTIAVGDGRIKQIRLAEVVPGKTRIVLDLEGPVEMVSSQLVNPDRLMIEIRPKGGRTRPALNSSRSMTGSQRVDLSTAQADLDKDPALDREMRVPNRGVTGPVIVPVFNAASLRFVPTVATLVEPILPLVAASVPAAAVTAARASLSTRLSTVSAAKNNSSGDRSLVRVFGLKLGRVVIDAGHGGKDTGTIGSNGLMEKDLVLDVALRLGKMITRQLGAEVIYTRSDDTFIPLEERTAIANRQKADLFISVHANSSPEPSVTGVETYYFNLHSDRKGLDLAMRENAASGSSISDLNDLLHRAVLQTKLEESREFAQKVQESLCANSMKMNSRARDRGVREAPFVVLIGATMPSILAEVGFVSNPRDEKLLKRVDQRQKIADALYKGVSRYAGALSHMQIARAGE